MYKKIFIKENYRLKAYITVEASYVMAVVLFCAANLIIRAYKESSRVKAGYITHTAALETSHLEEIYKKDNFNIEVVRNYALLRVGSFGGLDTGKFDIKLEKNKADASFQAGSLKYDIEDKINNPEKFMRKITALEGVYEKYKNRVQKTPEE